MPPVPVLLAVLALIFAACSVGWPWGDGRVPLAVSVILLSVAFLVR